MSGFTVKLKLFYGTKGCAILLEYTENTWFRAILVNSKDLGSLLAAGRGIALF
jgi:hypothetical protein